MFYKKWLCGILTVQILLCMFDMAKAQTEKGNYLIGGSSDISEMIQGTTGTFNLSLSPSFGIFAVKNFAIGGLYSFGVGSVRTYSPSSQTYSSVTSFTALVGPFFKYYLGKKSLKGVAMFHADYANSLTLRNSSFKSLDGFSVGGSLGIAHFFNPHVALETALYLNASGYKTQLPASRFGLSLGLYAFLDKKKKE